MPKIPTGYQTPDYSAMDSESTPKGNPKPRPMKTVYPDITLRGDAATQLIGAHKVGESFTAEVEFKLTGLHASKGKSQEYGMAMESGDGSETRVELEIMSIHAEDEPDGDEGDDLEQSADSAIDSFRAAKSAPPAEED